MPTNTDEQAALAVLQAEAALASQTEARDRQLGLPAEFGIRSLQPKGLDKCPLMIMFRMQASFPFAFEFVTADASFVQQVADTLSGLAREMLNNPDNAEYNGKENFTEDATERPIIMEQNAIGIRTYRDQAVDAATDSASSNAPSGEKVE